MHFIQSLVSFMVIATSVVTAIPAGGKKAPREEHIVLIDKDDNIPDHIEAVLNRVQMSKNHNDVRRVYDNPAFRGFSAFLDAPVAETLNAMTDVRTVDKNAQITLNAIVTSVPWGLERISSSSAIGGDEHTNEFTYRYKDASLGAGADVYVVDTGIRTTHVVFEGRARMGFSFDAQDTADEAGHGTHVSGTAAGDYFGVARLANIIGVKVLGADGTGSTSDVIAGIDYVLQQHAARKDVSGFIGSVMSMSLGLSYQYPSLDHAVKMATEEGVHVVVAAGNNGADACGFSPSHAGGPNSAVISVGSIGTTNAVSSFSNTGNCVDVYGPGESILSAWYTGDTMLQYLDGTSMATPHVSGIVTYLLNQVPALRQDPAGMKAHLKSIAISGAIPTAAAAGDEQLLANNGVGSALKRSRRSTFDFLDYFQLAKE